ncbi:MAG: T9SS type A sorting domain-containing protein [Candidatus Stahlbacteria bacterium]|nr:T9SS type A sorting domain-containing protein [Candidatus Stahlbacteria bacterium]
MRVLRFMILCVWYVCNVWAGVGELDLGFYYSPPLLKGWFNSALRDSDLIMVQVPLSDSLSAIQKGLKGVRSPCASLLIVQFPYYQGDASWIAYNIEHWPLTPDSEKADPVGTVQRLSQFAYDNALELTLGPDRRYDDSLAPEWAVYCDRYVLQMQQYERNIDTFQSQSLFRTRRLRNSNPNIYVIVQVSLTLGVSLDSIYLCIQKVADSVDCIWIHYSPTDTLSLQELVRKLRPTSIMEKCENLNVLSLKSYPNPFLCSTVISYQIPQRSIASLKIYDLTGRLVKTFSLTPNSQSPITKIVWDGKNEAGESMSSGLYFVKLSRRLSGSASGGKAGEFSQTKKLLLLR